MAGMHHALMIGSRILALLVFFFALYCVTFMYENERGYLQNRLETLWIAIDDKAKEINRSSSAALFNKIGDILVGWSNWLFGDRLFSLRGFLTSTNLSGVGVILGFITPILIGMFIQNRDDFGDQPVLYFTRIMIILSVFALVLLFLAILPSLSKSRIALFFASLTLIYSVVNSLVVSFSKHNFGGILTGLPSYAVPITVQYLFVTITRRLFKRISNAPKLVTLLGAMSIFLLFSFSLTVLPLIILTTVYHVPLASFKSANTIFRQLTKLTHPQLYIVLFAISNLTISLMSLLPFALLAVISLHKLIWPTLKRLLWPIADNKVLYNKTALGAIGTAAILYAVHPQQVGLKDILKFIF
jgi:hypothetical protein